MEPLGNSAAAVPDEPFLSVVMNGKQVLTAKFETVNENVYQSPQQVNGGHKGVYVHLTASTPCKVVGIHRVELYFWNGTQSADILLGFISEENNHVAGAMWIPFRPIAVRTVVERVEKAEDIDEIKFTRDVEGILKSKTLNPGNGSLPSALTQNHAKHLPQYKAVILGKYQSSWHQYLKNHPDSFTVFQGGGDCDNNSAFAKPHEVRVAHAQQGNTQEADRIKAEISKKHETELIAYLSKVLEGLDDGMDQRRVMDHLDQNEDFLHFVSPSFSTLHRFLVQQREHFAWTNHEYLPLCVGISRGGRKGEVSAPVASVGRRHAKQNGRESTHANKP